MKKSKAILYVSGQRELGNIALLLRICVEKAVCGDHIDDDQFEYLTNFLNNMYVTEVYWVEDEV